MKRRTMIGLLVVPVVGLLVGAGALAFAYGGHHGVMRRMVTAAIDDALDEAKVTAEQRTTIHAIRDRLLVTFEQHRQGRQGRLEEVLRLFEADRMDGASIEGLRHRVEEEHRQIADALSQGLLEAHDVLTPAQRTAIAGYVRAHRPRHMH